VAESISRYDVDGSISAPRRRRAGASGTREEQALIVYALLNGTLPSRVIESSGTPG